MKQEILAIESKMYFRLVFEMVENPPQRFKLTPKPISESFSFKTMLSLGVS